MGGIGWVRLLELIRPIGFLSLIRRSLFYLRLGDSNFAAQPEYPRASHGDGIALRFGISLSDWR